MSRYRFVQAALALLLALVATFSALPARVAFAATTLTNCSDSNAIEVQLEGGGDFVFNCGTVTITFINPIKVHADLRIDGSGSTTFTIGSTDQLFVLDQGVGLDLNRVTISGAGIAITNDQGTVTLSNSTFANNQTALNSLGGAVYIQDSAFTGHTGGALSFMGDGNPGAILSVTGGTFTNNHATDGGAISIDNDFSQSQSENPHYTQATIDGVSFSNNSADQGGGAISNRRGDLVVTNSTFSDNLAGFGGAIYDRATQLQPGEPVWDPNKLTISTSTFIHNTAPYGGGVTSNGTLSLERSTLAANVGGALLLTGGSASVTNSTFYLNGRDIRNGDGNGNPGAVLKISSSTFSGNGTAVTIEAAAGTTSINNSIVQTGCSGKISSGGHNIISDAKCLIPGTGDLIGTDPLLGPLGNNGGSTLTVAVLSGSPAIDAGSCPGLTTDQRGVTRPQGAACDIGAIEDDSSAPDTSFVNPPAFTGAAGGPFAFASTEASSTFQCKLDSGSFSDCTSPASFPGLADGMHALQVQATDLTGQVDPTPASLTWIVDTTAPETTLLTQPASLSNISAPGFTFSGSDANGIASFECALDAVVFTTCGTPAAYANLSDGSHTFHVRAIDAAGNADATPASVTWTIDATGPETTILTTPPLNSGSTSATFTFSGSDTNGIARLECKLDNGNFATCTSPRDLSTLGDGPHTFQVRAVDSVGNVDPTPATYNWTIDTLPPDTSILTMPASISNATSPSFTFGGSDAGSIASYECKLDAAAFAACSSPLTPGALSDGSHTFQVRAIDATGHIDPSPASYTWTVDTFAPVSQASLSGNQTGSWFVDSATLSLSAGDPNHVASIKFSVDSGALQTYSAPVKLTGNGPHTVTYYAVDSVGNAEKSHSLSLSIDAAAPSISISAPVSGTPYLLNSAVNASFSCSDPNGSGIASCLGANGPISTSSQGSHSFSVTATDNVGKVTTKTVTYMVGYPFTLITTGSGGYGGLNQVFAGDPVYLKFSLGGNFGLNVLSAGYPRMQQTSCSSGAALGSAVALPVLSGLRYMAGGYYQIVWKTQASWAGKCYQVSLSFNDGSSYRITYHFVTKPGIPH